MSIIEIINEAIKLLELKKNKECLKFLKENKLKFEKRNENKALEYINQLEKELK